jgi:hypothetical protein
MVSYTCQKCNKSFDDKSKYTKHANRKTDCVITIKPELTELIGEDREFGGNELFIDLIPSSCWFTNVRTSIKGSSWNVLRKHVYERVNSICECCNNVSDALEAHERWDYNDETKTQKLMRIVALCKACHQVTHFGRTSLMGGEEHAKQHLMKTRGFDELEFYLHKSEASSLWKERSNHIWSLDLSLIENNGFQLVEKKTNVERKQVATETLDRLVHEFDDV